MTVCLMLIGGCVNLPAKNDVAYCLWATPITVSEKEYSSCLTDETKRQIDNYDQIYKRKCVERKQ
jgi:hypothetical protein